jgi:hypothetical protein
MARDLIGTCHKQHKKAESYLTLRGAAPVPPMPVGIVLTFSAAFFAFCAAFFSAFRIVFSSDVSFAIAPSHADPSFRTIVARQPRGEDGNRPLKGQRTPTRPDGKIEALFRFYGPQQALFDKTWVLPDIEEVM